MPRRFLRGHNRRLIGSKGWLEGAYRYISVNGVKIAEHRHVVEQREGRKLTSKEIVHHIDEDKLNNDPDNLVVLTRGGTHAPTCASAKVTMDTRREDESEGATHGRDDDPCGP